MNINIEINLLKARIAELEKQNKAMKAALDAILVPPKRTSKKADAE